MSYILSKLLYKFLRFIDFFFKKTTNRSLLIFFKDFIENDSYKSIKILNKKVIFFTPNYITNWLIDTFFKKEPEIIEWIDNFKGKEILFWDIGANIGVYSIYAALKHKNIKIISFEPSTSNLRILSRNIYINNLQNKIFINQLPLSNVNNEFQIFNENKFLEGVGLHTFGHSKDQFGKKIKSQNSYKILGSTINHLIKNKILKLPDYIKIDVDGIEHLILDGGKKYLKNKKIKSMYIELNEKNKYQYMKSLNFLKKNNFKLVKKNRSEYLEDILDKKMKGIYNFIFNKN